MYARDWIGGAGERGGLDKQMSVGEFHVVVVSHVGIVVLTSVL